MSLSAYSQRKYSNEFLSIGVGARGLGMANSVVASVDDCTSGFWNPAGLTLINQDLQIAAMHSEYFAGIGKYDYATVAKTMFEKNMAISLSLIRFGVDDIPNTLFWKNLGDDTFDDSKISSFSAVDYAFLISLSKQLYSYGTRTATGTQETKSLRLGATAKIVHRTVGTFAHSWGFGIDAGAQYYYHNLRLGLMAKDITTTFNAWSFTFTDEEKEVLVATDNIVPDNSVELTLPKVILATGYHNTIYKKIAFLAEIDLDMTTDGRRNVAISTQPVSIDPHAGLELSYDNFIFVRGGIGNFQKSTDDEGKKIITNQPNFGVGLRVKNIAIDYALTNLGQQIGLLSNVFSLKVSFVKQQKEKIRKEG